MSSFFDESVVAGESLAQLPEFLDSCYPGMCHRIIDERDRILPHRFFVNRDGLTRPGHRLQADVEVTIVAALSGV